MKTWKEKREGRRGIKIWKRKKNEGKGKRRGTNI